MSFNFQIMVIYFKNRPCLLFLKQPITKLPELINISISLRTPPGAHLQEPVPFFFFGTR